MKRIYLLLSLLILCMSLCSCESLLEQAKARVTGEEVSLPPADYIGDGENGEYTYEIYETYIKITEYLGEETAVSIPSEIMVDEEAKPVTAIGELCFYEKSVDSVSIPDSVTSIDASAFYDADELESIIIPDTVTSIGERAFAGCDSLEYVKLSENITEIPAYCFNRCSALETVDIPDSVTSIGLRAFSYCDSITEQVVPKNVESVGARAFAGCPVLEFVIFENDSVSLGEYMFDDTFNVIVISDENSAAYDYCVKNGMRWSTSKSVSAIILGDGTHANGETERPSDYISTFEGEEYVYEIYDDYIKIIKYIGEDAEVSIPSEIDDKPVTVIGENCFYQKNIVSVAIPESVTRIEQKAFYEARELESVEIPDSVTYIGIRAFASCDALAEVELGTGIAAIPEYCFYRCASLVLVEIPNNVKEIGDNAFAYCESLVDQEIPKTVTSVGKQAFAYYIRLKYVTFENDFISLGSKIFKSSENSVIIAVENSTAYKYCVENQLKWSDSKTGEVVDFGNADTSDDTDISDTSSESDIQD